MGSVKSEQVKVSRRESLALLYFIAFLLRFFQRPSRAIIFLECSNPCSDLEVI
jgi:hypothetical protein